MRRSRGRFLVGCGTASYAALTGTYLFSPHRRAAGQLRQLGSEFKYLEHFLTERSLVHRAVAERRDGRHHRGGAAGSRPRGATIAAPGQYARLDARCGWPTSASARRGAGAVRPLDQGLHRQAGGAAADRPRPGRHARDGRALLRRAGLANRRDFLRRRRRAADARRWRALSRAQGAPVHRSGAASNYPTALEAALKIKEVSLHPRRGLRRRRVEARRHRADRARHALPRLRARRRDARRHPLRRDGDEGARRLHHRRRPNPLRRLRLSTSRVGRVGDAQPIVNVVPAQLLGYHLALLRGHDPDKPRNLAKSVTVK